MKPSSRPTLIHLQMGQDVLYVVLSFFILVSVVLAVIAIQALARTDAVNMGAEPISCDDRARSIVNRPQMDKFIAPSELVALANCYVSQLAQPPIITLREADGYFFASGSSALSPAFTRKIIETIAPMLAKLGEEYNAQIIEVVGHTDEQHVRSAVGRSTLDDYLLKFLHNEPVSDPAVTDNVGLGMARAAAIVRLLRSQPMLARFEVLPLSAGQAVDLRERLAVAASVRMPIEQRRRIEIRLRRSREADASNAPAQQSVTVPAKVFE